MLIVHWYPPSTGSCRLRRKVSSNNASHHLTLIIACIDKQVDGAKEFVDSLSGLVNLFERAEKESASDVGLWKDGGKLSLADVMAGPCKLSFQGESIVFLMISIGIFRATNVLPHYRGFILPKGEKFTAYVERLLNYPAFRATCSTEQLYLDSYERCVAT